MSRFAMALTHRVVTHLRSNVVGYLALVIAMCGTSYAAIALPANSVGNRQLKRGVVTLSKINAGTQRTLHGRTGKRGSPGKPGLPGTALGYAHVLADGSLDTTRSRNIAGVTKPSGTFGIYCFSLDFTPKSATATLENAAIPPNVPPDAFLSTNVGTAPQACPAGSEGGLVMRGPGDTAIVGAPFFIVFN